MGGSFFLNAYTSHAIRYILRASFISFHAMSKGISMTIFGSTLVLFSTMAELPSDELLSLGIRVVCFVVGVSLAIAGMSQK